MGLNYDTNSASRNVDLDRLMVRDDYIRDPDKYDNMIATQAPKYVFRGHGSSINAVRLFAQNLRLVSGDADGWVVVWDMVTKRPIVSWKAHEGPLLEVKGFQFGSLTEIYTHGKDHKLCLWGFHVDDELSLNKVLPLDVSRISNMGTLPSLVYSLPVNALNYCAFSLLFLDNWSESRPADETWTPDYRPASQSHAGGTAQQTEGGEKQGEPEPRHGSEEAQQSVNSQAAGDEGAAKPLSVKAMIESGRGTLIAAANALDSGAIDVYHLPSKRRVSTISSESSTETGMLMAVYIFISKSNQLYVASGYEDGQVMLFVCCDDFRDEGAIQNGGIKPSWKWEKVYSHKSHTQPLLSLDISPCKTYFLTSAADNLLVKHRIPTSSPEGAAVAHSPIIIYETRFRAQDCLRIRSDGLVFATACWDDDVRVYRYGTAMLLVTFGWHLEGCRSLAFGEIYREGDSSIGPAPECPKTPEEFTLAALQRKRVWNVQTADWLVMGSKKGRISAWDLYWTEDSEEA